MSLSFIDVVGWLAAGLTLATALMRTMIPLRVLAASSNVMMIGYAAFVGAYPTLAVHSLLLPLNLYRLMQMRRLVRDISLAAANSISPDWLAPFSNVEERRAGEVLFRRGDKGDRLYYLCTGRIRFAEIDAEIAAGSLFGEVAFFIPEGVRTQTAVCLSDCRLLSIGESQLKQIYFQNPQFGWYLVRLVAERLSVNARRAERSALPPGAPGSAAGA